MLKPASAGYLSKQLPVRSEEHTSELQSRLHLVCRLLLEKNKTRDVPEALDEQVRLLRSRIEARDHRDVTYARYDVTFTLVCYFFFNDTATTEIYTLSLHDALPIYRLHLRAGAGSACHGDGARGRT